MVENIHFYVSDVKVLFFEKENWLQIGQPRRFYFVIQITYALRPYRKCVVTMETVNLNKLAIFCGNWLGINSIWSLEMEMERVCPWNAVGRIETVHWKQPMEQMK